MTITINAQGSERKRLVQCISQWLGCEPNYLGAPSFAYQVDYFTIEKSGSLTFDDAADSEVIERLLQHIYDEGFDIHNHFTESLCILCLRYYLLFLRFRANMCTTKRENTYKNGGKQHEREDFETG